MWEKFCIGVRLWHELDIGAGFNDWFRLRVEHNTHVVTVTHAQLLAEDSHLAIWAITDEDGALGRSYHYGWVLASVNKALCYVIIHVELAVLAVVDGEVFAIKLSRGAEQEFVLFVREK